MSIKIMSQVWENADVADTDLLLLLAMADFANDDYTCWPSIETLAKRIRKTTRSVTRSVNSLEQKGFIEVLVRGAGRQSSRYKILVSAVKDKQESRGDNLSPVTPMSPQHRQPCHPSPDTGVTSALTPMSTDPLIEPSIEPPKNHQKKPPKSPKGGVSKKLHHSGLPLDALWKESFEDFWDIYPKKRGKETAKNSWYKLKGDEHLYCDICNAVIAWSKTEDWLKNDGQFVPNASTFLNQKRWQDDIPAAKPVDRTDPKWMAENDDYTAIGGTKGLTLEEYDVIAKQLGWDKRKAGDE